MKVLSYFVDTDYSRALMAEYGDCLQAIQAECAWLKNLADGMDNYSLALAMHTNSSLSSYGRNQQVLFRLGLDIYDGQVDNLNCFREILTEYA